VSEAGAIGYATSGELRIAYQVFGKGPLNLVIVPGFVSNLDLMTSAPSFKPLFDRLGRFARCVAFDKRGTGLSDRDLGFGSLEERAEDIRVVMDAVGMERAALFGYSEGGPLSVVFAASFPERVQALALYGSFARLEAAPDYPDGLQPDTLPPLLDYVEEHWGTGRALLPFLQHVPDTDEARNLLARYERGACTPTMARHILEANFAIDVRPILPTLSMPALVLHSEQDPLVGVEHGRHLADDIPNARFVTSPADYHMTWDGNEAWFVDELETFLTGERRTERPSERFLGTVLFTDIVGSTEQAAKVGDRAWRGLLDRHDALAAEQVTSFGGRVVKTTGDGLLATLDGPSRAVECAVAIRDAVDALGLKVRAGVHTGEFERRGSDIGGLGVNIGSRVAALAGPSEVWVSRTVKDLTSGSGLHFQDQGRHALKGVPDEWELYSVVG
jgi:pimeloyl-ACP methyl ester carboxylesterase/class 3 adenylate cyclase